MKKKTYVNNTQGYEMIINDVREDFDTLSNFLTDSNVSLK
jgi:hypothetical protein